MTERLQVLSDISVVVVVIVTCVVVLFVYCTKWMRV